MSPETRMIEIVPIDTVPEHAKVRHYDELDEEIKEKFPELVADRSRNWSGQDIVAAFGNCGCEIVKFTDYYHIMRGEC